MQDIKDKDPLDELANDDVAFLGSMILFQTVPRPALENLAQYLQRHTYKSRAIIIRKGERGADLLIIRAGTVSVLVNRDQHRVELTRLGEGSYFGEMALFDEYPRSATVVAVGEVDVLRIEKEVFCQWAFNYPMILFQMCKIFSHRLRRTNSLYAKH
jgi:CRP-like cAMP-binding protein